MSIMPQAPDSKTVTPPLGQEPTHGVCPCQVDATPRLAVCGADVSGDGEGWTDTMCVVCFDLVIHRAPCEHCGRSR